jgi:2-amino-4-hydroxy-6-hydroxymethyldihydropteridine diphosphokinase
MATDLDSGAARVFVGLGSNLGDRQAYLEAALRMLEGHPAITVLRCTRFEETEPWGRADQPRFLNAVAELATAMDPRELLHALKEIERRVGRKEGGLRWGPREIDLDILLHGDAVLRSEELVVPHPRLEERSFVLRQLLELDDSIAHPTTGVPYREYLGRH